MSEIKDKLINLSEEIKVADKTELIYSDWSIYEAIQSVLDSLCEKVDKEEDKIKDRYISALRDKTVAGIITWIKPKDEYSDTYYTVIGDTSIFLSKSSLRIQGDYPDGSPLIFQMNRKYNSEKKYESTISNLHYWVQVSFREKDIEVINKLAEEVEAL